MLIQIGMTPFGHLSAFNEMHTAVCSILLEKVIYLHPFFIGLGMTSITQVRKGMVWEGCGKIVEKDTWPGLLLPS